jgi:Reverse transcriptase (RNA-dependent DNA polymerase)
LSGNDNQFGFKQGLGGNHAIYTVRNIVNRFIDGGSTANFCTLDFTKAFDKVGLNHKTHFIKHMQHRPSTELLDTLVSWSNNCWSYVKWNDVISQFYKLEFGVRQGSVISPFLFAIHLDEIIDYSRNCYYNFVIFLR